MELRARLSSVPDDAVIHVYGGDGVVKVQAEWNSFLHPTHGEEASRVVAAARVDLGFGGVFA